MLHKTVLCMCFLLLQRLYRETYHKQKDKIHTTYDTPDIKQVKMNQEHLSDVRAPTDYNIHVLFFLNSCCKMDFFCSLLTLVVLQREILQQQRPADIVAHNA